MKEIKNFKEFKEEAEILRKKDMKDIAKMACNKLPISDYMAFKEIMKNSLIQEFLRTAWTGGLHAGVKLTIARINNLKKREDNG